MKRKKISTAKAAALDSYIKESQNLKRRISYLKEKKGIESEFIILSKKELKKLTPSKIKILTKSIKSLRGEKLKKKGKTYEKQYKELYRKDQQVLSNFYKGMKQILNQSDSKMKEFVDNFLRWFSNLNFKKQIEFLKQLDRNENLTAWNYIYGSGDMAGDGVSSTISNTTINIIKETAKRFGYKENIYKKEINWNGLTLYKKNKEIYEEEEFGGSLITASKLGEFSLDKSKSIFREEIR